jgi:peptide/nickel transport system permease protein
LVYGWPAWPARLQATSARVPIIMGVTLVAAVAIVLGNLLADLVTP